MAKVFEGIVRYNDPAPGVAFVGSEVIPIGVAIPQPGGGGGSGIDVQEVDGTPGGAASELRFPNGSLTEVSSGVFEVRYVQPGAAVTRSTSQTISNNTFTAISFDTEGYDRGGYWDAGQPTRFTIPSGQGGFFDVYFSGEYDSATGSRQWLFLVNGTNYLQTNVTTNVSGGARSFALIYDLPLSAGDYIECLVYQDSGASRTFSIARASIRKVG